MGIEEKDTIISERVKRAYFAFGNSGNYMLSCNYRMIFES